jgi:PAS domain S-box-containing protein
MAHKSVEQLQEDNRRLRERVEQLESFCSVLTDKAEAEKAQEALDMAERKGQAMFDHAPVGVFLVDGQGRYLNVNPKHADLCGFEEPGKLLRKVSDMYEHLFGDREGHVDEVRTRMREQGEVLDEETRVTARDGTELWLSVSLRRLGESEERQEYATGFALDIRERKRLEKLRFNVERVIRHDMKNPLLGVLSGAKLLAQHADEPERREELVELIRDQGQKAMDMLYRSLDLIRMEQGVYELDVQEFDLGKVLKRVDGKFCSMCEDKGVARSYFLNGEEYGFAESIPCQGEEELVENLLDNLMRNAVEASPEQSEVTVRVRREDHSLRLDMHNPTAIPEEIRDLVFKRYATSGKKGGLGIGAYMAKLIVDTHGGDISFDTSEQEGTTIHVRLPCQPPREP